VAERQYVIAVSLINLQHLIDHADGKNVESQSVIDAANEADHMSGTRRQCGCSYVPLSASLGLITCSIGPARALKCKSREQRGTPSQSITLLRSMDYCAFRLSSAKQTQKQDQDHCAGEAGHECPTFPHCIEDDLATPRLLGRIGLLF
jgi:hypothetical protein